MTEPKCKNCKYCKYWDVSPVYGSPKNHNPCTKIEYVFSYEYNEGIKDPSMKNKTVLVTCGEDWRHGIEANLYTGPEFGCILFEERKD